MTWLAQSVHSIPLGTGIGLGATMNFKQPIGVKMKPLAGNAKTKTPLFLLDGKEEGQELLEGRSAGEADCGR